MCWRLNQGCDVCISLLSIQPALHPCVYPSTVYCLQWFFTPLTVDGEKGARMLLEQYRANLSERYIRYR